jgi:hypothetical protein
LALTNEKSTGIGCAICHEPAPVIVDFGPQPLANGFADPTRVEPLTLARCRHCDLYQLSSQVPPQELFVDYAYRTGSTRQSAVWGALADDALRRHPLPAREGLVVDIGGNDGSLLLEFQRRLPRSYLHLNIDPFAPAGTDDLVRTITLPWSAKTAEYVRREWRNPADFIFATNVWAHMPDLHGSTEGAVKLLADDGWLVVQAPWHRDLVYYDEWDTIYHEHIYALGVHAMRTLMREHGLDVCHVDYLPTVHGGSLRYWIQHEKVAVPDASVGRFEDIELDLVVPTQTRFERWRHAMRYNLQRLRKPLWAVGAAAKAVMFFGMTDTGGYVDRIFDDTPQKIGRTLPGTILEVEDLGRDFQPPWPAAVLLTAWNHEAALTARLRDLGYHGKIIVANHVTQLDLLPEK